MDMIAFLTELRQIGVKLALDGTELVLEGRTDLLTSALVGRIRAHKADLIVFLLNARQALPLVSAREQWATAQHCVLSFAQQRMWFLDQFESGSATYNIPTAVRMSGRLDADALNFSVNQVIGRHEALRTRFESSDGVPRQVIASELHLELPLLDLSAMSEQERAAGASDAIRQCARAGFDLASGPLIRCLLLRMAFDEHVFVLTLHHIVTDGWSMGVLIREIAEMYAARVMGKEAQLPALPVQYADFAHWQRQWLTGDVLERQLTYWRTHLAGAPTLLALPTDRLRPSVQTFRGAVHAFELTSGATAGLRALGQSTQATLFMTLNAALAVLLSRYSGQDDVCIGTPIANRSRSETTGLIGLFVNSLVLRTRIDHGQRFDALLALVRATALGAYAHQDVPFEQIVEAVKPERHTSHSPLFQVLLSIDEARKGGDIALPGLKLGAYEPGNPIAKFDLTLHVSDAGEQLAMGFEYNTDLFDAATIERMAGHFVGLLDAVVAAPNARVGDLPMLGEAERDTVLRSWNASARPSSQYPTVHAMVEAQAARTPERCAMVFEGGQLSYAQLNAQANRLAHHLRGMGVGPDVLVGICVERSPMLVVAMLATLKAGGAYLPLDPNYPADRLGYMLADAKPAVLLTQERLRSLFAEVETEVLCLDQVDVSACSDTNPVNATLPQHLVYVIYTSGSTGRPKGTAVQQRGFVNLLDWFIDQFGLDQSDKVLLISSFSFDLTQKNIFGVLAVGGELHLAADGFDPPLLHAQIMEQGISFVNCAPSAFYPLLACHEAGQEWPLRQVFLGGESINGALLKEAFAGLSRPPIFHNTYGPTEASDVVSFHTWELEAPGDNIPIGQPVSNTELYVLDADCNPVPVGVAGELHVAGDGLARGYLGRPELTAEKFVPNPFGAEPGERMYKTGDLARHRPDGLIEYLGRIDNQVKVRGFRIELGEVEAALAALPVVQEAAVLAREDGALGDKRLVAYVVVKPGAVGGQSDATALREALRAFLPDFMLPSHFVMLDALPLNPNGKVDRKALPAPSTERVAGDGAAPQTPGEIAIAAIWEDVLGVSGIGADDDFFVVGGHSLLATQVLSRINTVLGRELSLRTLFEAPTVRALARRIESVAQSTTLAALVAADRDQPLPLSFAQQRLWFLQALEGASATYNMAVALRLHGELDVGAMRAALQLLVQRQEVLRMRVVANALGEPQAEIVPALTIPFEVTMVAPEQVGARAQGHAQHCFDLAQGPLLIAELLAVGENEHVLLLNVHHIVSDGWSMGVLAREWMHLYESVRAGRPSTLPALPVQYADYALWQHGAQQVACFDTQLAYWKSKLAGAPELLNMPLDRPRPPEQRFDGALETVFIESLVAQRLHAVSRAGNASLFMTMVAAFALLMSRQSGETDVMIGTPSANRSRQQLEGLIGLFLGNLVLRADLAGAPSFRTLLERMRDTTLDALANADVPFERIVDALELRRDLSRNPLFQVFFNMLNLPVQTDKPGALRMEGLEAAQYDAKFDLTVYAQETGGGILLQLVYNRTLFDACRMQELLRQFSALLEQVAAAPDTCIDDYSLTTGEARAVLPDPSQPLDAQWRAPVHELFDAHCAGTPQATAIVSHERSWTYAQLQTQTERIACYLQDQGVQQGDIVAIHAARNASVVAAVLGVLKTGAAFMMLDPAYPPAHLGACMEAAPPRAWLQVADVRQDAALLALTESVPVVLDLRDIDNCAALLPYADQVHSPVELDADCLALIGFTSGSTGKPKAVEARHGPLTHFMPWVASHFGLTSANRFSMLSGLAHDPLQRDIFTSLCIGARLYIPHPDTIMPGPLANWMRDHAISVAHLTPAMAQILSEADAGTSLPALRRVFLVGDVLTRRDVQRLQSLAPEVAIVNYYGSTETQRSVSYYALESETASEALREVIPLGHGIPGVQLLVLNRAGRQAGIGEHGEIYVRSAHLARGYRHDPELTGLRFVPNPFGAGPHDRMYRTGDLGRYMPNGMVECLGRADTQIKLRGFRIELGHIESVLGQHAQIREAIVVIHTAADGDKLLVAYLVAQPGFDAPDAEALRAWLGSRVPDYMQPSRFVVLEALPLTPNGKVNRAALPAPEMASASADYTAPRNAQEAAVAAVWEQVLGRPRIGVHDNFFALGGHSLRAVAIVERMRRAGMHADVRTLFVAPTIAGLAASLGQAAFEAPPNGIPAGCALIAPQMLPLVQLDGEEITLLAAAVPGGCANIQDIYPLAPLQEGILFHHMLGGPGDTYLIPTAITFDTRARANAFIDALRQVIARHDALRTAFLWEALREPVQVVLREAPLVLDERSFDPQHGSVAQQLAASCDPRIHRIDVREAPLVRVCMAQEGERVHMQVLAHHLVNDHTSLGFVIDEIGTILAGRPELLAPPVPFRNFVALARLAVHADEHAAFFRTMLGDVDEPTAPFGLRDARGDGAALAEAHLALDPALAQRLRAQARAQGVTVASMAHLAWALVLGRASGREDVVFGTVMLGRLQGGAANARALGMFINTLPLRVRLAGLSAAEAVQATHAGLTGLLRHEHAPLSLAQRCSGVALPAPLFTALLNYRHSSEQHADAGAAPAGMQVHGSTERTNYPLTLAVDDVDTGLYLTVRSTGADPHSVCAQMQAALQALTVALETAPTSALAHLDVLPDAERARLIGELNSPVQADVDPVLLAALFERQAESHGTAAALECGELQLSYAQLNARANQYAHRLIALGIGAGDRVVLCAERSIEMVAGLLAIWKAGAAYVPLDPHYPPERLAFMLRDSAPAAVLAEPAVLARLPSLRTPLVALGGDVDGAAHNPPARAMHDAHLAYVIYTSGSTGQPKGVMVEQRGVRNLWRALSATAFAGCRPGSRVALNGSMSFDGSLKSIVQLFSGHCLVLVPQEIRADGAAMAAFLTHKRINAFDCTPAQLDLLLAAGPLAHRCAVVVGGEALSMSSWHALRQKGALAAFNVYGPTECTVDATWMALTGAGPEQSIGRPLANARVYLLDAQLNPVPFGAPGEIHIGGAGVARGYLGRADLSAERFVPDPFAGVAGARMYRTGDLARYLADGTIACLGRLDDQVKVRGYRIELGEIAAALGALPGVAEAQVLLREDTPGDKRLVAYVTGAGAPDAVHVRRALGAILPDFMVPSDVVLLERFPLTPNGKVDRKALPAPAARRSDQNYVAPRSEAEAAIAAVWAEVLKVEQVGAADNFFALGGHSLLAVTIIERLRRQGLHTDVRALFSAPTVAGLAAQCGSGQQMAVPPNLIAPGCTAITPDMLPLVTLEAQQIERIAARVPGGCANIQDIYPLAPLQEGILFHHLMQERGDTYLLPTTIAFDTRTRLDAFLGALQRVVERHDILRSAMAWEGLAAPVQVVWRSAPIVIEELALEAGDALAQLAAHCDPARVRLDVREAPLLRCTIAHDAAQQRWLLCILAHHLVSDHTTLEVLIGEIAAILQGRAAALAPPLPFRDFVARARLGVSEAEHTAFFSAMLADVTEPTAPFGLLNVHGDGSGVREARLDVEAQLAQRVRAQARSHGVSAASLVHLAWALVLGRSCGRDEVVFGTLMLGRMQGGAGADRALGMFINTLPVCVRLGARTAATALRQTHAMLTAMMRHEHAPLSLAQRCSGVTAPAPLFSALLNYRHSEAPAVQSEPAPSNPGLQMLGMRERTNYPLGLAVDDYGQGFRLTAHVDGAVTPQRVCDMMHAALDSLAAALESHPEASLAKIDIVPPDERRALLARWQADSSPPYTDSVVRRFERQCAAHPDAPALEFQGSQVSYAELDARANRLAHHLRQSGVERDRLVGIAIERTPDMVVAVLAVLKAGGAYVPLDPQYPRERLAYMLADASPVLVLTQQALLAQLPLQGVSAFCLDTQEAGLADAPQGHTWPDPAADDLAYVIYTSGSSGRPKGVLLTHGGLANLAVDHGARLRITPASRVLQAVSLNFDPATGDMFFTLLHGACLVLADSAQLQPGSVLAATLRGLQISHVQLAHAMLGATPAEDLPALELVVTGGEACSADVLARWAPGRRFINAYGPSETVVCATSAELDAADGRIHIGTPIGGMRALVLDAHGNLAPFGVAGELVLGGVQLARGYLHQAALSAERFVPDLLSGPGARMYKTGDLARMHEDGSIDCLGRIDEQVKIRGFRIEPGEIETVLAAFAGVREVAVIAREDAPGDKRLVAYLAAEPMPDQQQLRAHLLRSLPDYMVPAHFVALETLPLTANGKLDRRALPAPDLALAGGRGGAPRSALEAELAQLWAELLGRELVGIDDNFFELGGHSLLVMLLVSRIEQRWGRKVPVAQLFQTPTIGALAAVLEQAGTGGLLLPLREGGADAALFLVHAGGGDAQCYADLAQALPAGRAVYGIQSPDAAGLRIEPYERAVVCNAYADAIVAQQPHGPYLVGGWSLGGTLALEVAGILEGRGHLVAAVLLLDTMRKVDAAAQRFELDTYLDHVLLYGEADFTNTFSKALLPLRERLAALAAGQGTLHIAQMLASHDPALETQWGFRAEWQKVFVDNFKTMQRHASLARGFHPPALRAPVHSFWAQLSIERGAEVGAWAQASTNAHSSAQVLPGSHLTLIYGASATLLASRLDAVLPATVPSTLLEI